MAKTFEVSSRRYLIFMVILSLLCIGIAGYSIYNLDRVYQEDENKGCRNQDTMSYWIYLVLSLLTLIILMFLYFCECQKCEVPSAISDKIDSVRRRLQKRDVPLRRMDKLD